MSIQLRCCENVSKYQIDYSIGTSYLVCEKCFNLQHYSRGIKSKKNISGVLT